LRVIGDIIGGSGKTFKLSLQQAGDVTLIDSELGQPILATSVSLATGGTQTVSSGSLQIVKRTDTPSGNITKNASNAVLGKFDLKAAGEPMKIENLSVSITQTGNTAGTFALRNGALFADGVQVGNTAAINGDNHSTTAYTSFNLGSSLIVYPGKPVVLEVRADVYNTAAATADALESADTIKANLVLGVDNVKRMQTLDYADSVAVSANELTVATGNLTVSKNTAYATQTTVAPKTAYKIASFNVISTETENFNLDTITVTLDGDASYFSSTTDLYIKYGTKTSSVKTTVTQADEGANVFNISEVLAPNTTMPVEVYATLASTYTNDLVTKLTVAGTAANSSATVSAGPITGQTIQFQAASISAAVVSDSTLSTKLLVGNTQPKVASFRFTALNDTYTITDIALRASTTGGAITSLVLKSAGMADKIVFLGTATGNDAVATSSGMTLSVPANNTTGTVVDVYLNLNDIGANAGSTGSDVRIVLDTYKAQTSAGSTETKPTDVYGNSMYVFKSIPTISLVTLPSTTLTNGTKTLSKFTVAADAAGAIGWKQIVWQVAKTAEVTLARTSVSLVDGNNNTISGTFATSTATQAGTYMFDDTVTTGYLSFIADDEQQIAAGDTVTYSLKGTIDGTASNRSFGTYIDQSATSRVTLGTNDLDTIDGTAGAGTVDFAWTDRSANSHSASTFDWYNEFKIKTLPTDSQTMTGA
jgi:hypothetical protein